MKKLYLILGMLTVGSFSGFCDPASVYDQTPLPPGAILKQAPDFSHWQITFTYTDAKSASGSSDTSGASNPANAPTSHLPRLLTVVRTKPLWHSSLLDVSGARKELWFDGVIRYQVGPKASDIVPIAKFSPSYSAPLLDYSSGRDFPDMEFVSERTYLGMQKNTPYWVFQEKPQDTNAPAAMVWINSTTHLPVRWQKGSETRTIQFLDAPTELLTFPPDIANLSLGMKKLNDLSRAAPPHL